MKNFFLKKMPFVFCFSLGAVPLISQAQYNIPENNIWAFGNKSGLDFNSGQPVLYPTAIKGPNAGSASVCDSSGALLFYTNGHTIWDKNDSIMPNGDTLFPIVGRLSPYSAPQGALIAPVLNSPGQYYVFSAEGRSFFSTDSAASRLWYSVVDMSLNGGLGDVVPGQRSLPLDSGINGAMLSVRGTDCNLWVITHAIDEPVFKAYNITAEGIDPQPVISPVGTLAPVAYSNFRMCISPDGSMLAVNSTGNGGGILDAGIELYDFDPATGQLSNAAYIDHIGGTGIAFSPDNTKLYITGISPSDYKRYLYQYDVSLPTVTAITNSRLTVAEDAQWIGLSLAPNGKIYHLSGTGSNQRLAAINQPNLSAPACDYQDSVLLNPGPTFFQSDFTNRYIKAEAPDTMLTRVLDTALCPGFDSLVLEARFEAPAYLWSDSSTDNHLVVSGAGTYYVRYATDVCSWYVDTFVVAVYEVPEPIITIEGFTLGTTVAYAGYQWYLNGQEIPGATNRYYEVSENGDYTVLVETEEGCTAGSDPYPINNANSIADREATARQVKIYPNPSEGLVHIASPIPVKVTLTSLDGKILAVLSETSVIDIRAMRPGLYLLHLTDLQGHLIKVEKLVRQN